MINNGYKNHFFGSIVSIYNDIAKGREYLIIDGQQRITTINLLLLAIYNILSENKLKSGVIIKEKILNQYLINQYSSLENKNKLKPIKDDRKALERIFLNQDLIDDSNITANYKYFYDRILNEEISIDDLYSAIERLMIVEIELKNGEDDPQLIFESLNSTGLDLTDADKVRNFILMNESSERQDKLYNIYWNKIENNTNFKVTQFIRDYLTMKENKITNINKIYINFKRYIQNGNIKIEDCLKDMLKFSVYYKQIIKNSFGIKEVDESLKRINKLEVTVAYPFFLEVLDDYHENLINKTDIIEIFSVIETYIFRRILCKVPTNALNKVFMNMCKEIKKMDNYKENYLEILKYILSIKKSSQRFPNDSEFKKYFIQENIYNWKSKNKLYLLERLENYNNNEKVDIENLINDNKLSIEHIMPQKLTTVWKKELGDRHIEIYDKYINTIGNLTLTGYNSSLSNKTFIEKRDMEKGFKESRLKLNKYLSEIDCWNEENIKKRALRLYTIAKNIWKYPEIKYTVNENIENLFTLGDTDDFTNSKASRYIFRDENVNVKDWTGLYEKICFKLYSIDPIPFKRLTKKNFEKEHLKKRFSTEINMLRNPLKIDHNLYIEKNLSTESKLETLRSIFDEYSIDYNELIFYIK